MFTKLFNLRVTFALCFLIGILSQGCAKYYEPSSNLDSDNFIHYFSPSRVKIFESEADILLPHRVVGLVEGEACQVKKHHALPDELTARTDARRNAYKRNANGIVFSGCVMIDTQAQSNDCINTLVCYGQAFQIEQADDK